MKSFVLFACCLLFSSTVQARPQQRQILESVEQFVDIVGDVDGSVPAVRKAVADTTWIATWNFEGCDEIGWVRSDKRILNDGDIYWNVSNNFTGIGNISGDALAVGLHNLCWPFNGYDNDWQQGICIHYVGDSFLSFDWLINSEGGFDFLQVETDSACSSFGQVDYDVDPQGTAQAIRDLVWSVSGFDTVTARVDSVLLSGYATDDTHCVYIAFSADGAWSPADGLVPTVLEVGAVVDNVLLEGTMSVSEDFSSFTETAWFSLVNLQDSTPFGTWARTFSHITDNDICSENLTCAWLATDHTTPTFANDPSMAFGPNGYVIKNWLDEVLLGPWVSLSTTASAISTAVQFRRFPGNFFSTSRVAQNWSIRSRGKVANSDTPAPGDSIDCISSWGHGANWNGLGLFRWVTNTWDATGDFDPNARDVQLRFRESDWQWIQNGSPPNPFRPGPGPYWDRARIGRLVLSGPVVKASSFWQPQDAAPNDPTHEAGPLYSQATGVNEIFGTVAFSASTDCAGPTSANLIVCDSITVNVQDVLGNGGLVVELYASIVAGPHAGKAPAPYTVGSNEFFVILADSARSSDGAIIADRYFVDMDDTYFRGGDVLRSFWWATDQQGGARSAPSGLSSIPSSVAAAEQSTGGLFEVNYLPSIKWDPGYIARITADDHGDLEPTALELANSAQANCILYYEFVHARRRSGDVNRTSFMYTLDKLGYKGKYDIYDHMGSGNFNNHLGARMSPGQARNYSLLVYDTGNRTPGVLLPDGSDFDVLKIDMSAWFLSWSALSGAPNAEHTLWIIGANIMEEKPSDPLFASMAASFSGANQGQDANPDVFGVASFTSHTSCVSIHDSDQFALNGGCPTNRDYDDIRPIGTGVQTHVYGKGSPSNAGAIVMHANVNGYSTIMQSFAWSDLRSGIGQSPTKADEDLLATVLGCALPLDCLESLNPTNTGGDDKDRIAIPSRTVLHQNAPNPFNPTTTIGFDLARDASVSVKIYDVAGRLVRGLARRNMTAGYGKEILWNGLDDAGRRVSSGVYFYKLEAGDFQATRKMVVMK